GAGALRAVVRGGPVGHGGVDHRPCRVGRAPAALLAPPGPVPRPPGRRPRPLGPTPRVAPPLRRARGHLSGTRRSCCSATSGRQRAGGPLGTSRKGMSLSGVRSLGIISTRSETTLRAISVVPPPIEPAWRL